MPLFPSEAWMQAYCDTLASHPEVDAVAEALDGTYRFVVEPGGPLEDHHRYDVEVRADPTRVRLLGEPNGEPTLALRADFDRWRQLIEGRLDVRMALMLRRVKVDGDLGRIIGRLDRAGPLLESLGQVPTTWPDR